LFDISKGGRRREREKERVAPIPYWSNKGEERKEKRSESPT